MKKIYVAGIGPGDYESMTIKVERILRECDVIIGYTVYVELAERFFPGKVFLTTPMRQEEERCRMAFLEAMKGQTVAMICSGDAGIYGMAGLVLEIGKDFPEVSVEVVPGITAASSGAAVLGAPLMHDFAVISLSDLLTPWEKIEARLRLSAKADFAVCLYNPASKKRADYLKRACEIMMEYKDENTICGVVKNIGRDGEEKQIMSLKELSVWQADMFTTVFVGNSQTMRMENPASGMMSGKENNGPGTEGEKSGKNVIDCGWMVTPRGYRLSGMDGECRQGL